MIGSGNFKHGMNGSPEHWAWVAMRRRCSDETCKSFSDYGDRGIKVCEEWQNSFAAFFAHMGPRPSPAHTIERRDNERGYGPDNCHWADRKEQARNRRSSKLIEYRGREMTVAEACELAGVTQQLVDNRVRVSGWSYDRALDTPVGGFRKPSKTYKNGITVEIDGEVVGLAEAARRTGIKYATLRKRIVDGMPVHLALQTPLRVWPSQRS